MLGGVLHPMEAWLLDRGLKTFNLRMAQHNRSAQAVAEFLHGHPASTVSAVQSDEQIAASGVQPGLVRLSVGLEDPADIIADLAQALFSNF